MARDLNTIHKRMVNEKRQAVVTTKSASLTDLKKNLNSLNEYRNNNKKDRMVTPRSSSVVENVCRTHIYKTYDEYQRAFGTYSSTSYNDIDDALDAMTNCSCNSRQIGECDCVSRDMGNVCSCNARDPIYCNCQVRSGGKYDPVCYCNYRYGESEVTTCRCNVDNSNLPVCDCQSRIGNFPGLVSTCTCNCRSSNSDHTGNCDYYIFEANICSCKTRTASLCDCVSRSSETHVVACECVNRVSDISCTCDGRCSCNIVNEYDFTPARNAGACSCVSRSSNSPCTCHGRTIPHVQVGGERGTTPIFVDGFQDCDCQVRDNYNIWWSLSGCDCNVNVTREAITLPNGTSEIHDIYVCSCVSRTNQFCRCDNRTTIAADTDYCQCVNRTIPTTCDNHVLNNV